MDSAAPRNLLLEDIQYRVDETASGTWRRFLYPNGSRFEEYKSRAEFAGMPLLHYTYGICPETGRRVTARGVIAIGRFARGIIAIGHVAVGLIAFGQASLGLVFGVGQATAGAFCVGQLALGVIFGAGQVATGYIAVGQIAVGTYVLAQLGWGEHVIDTRTVDPLAKDFFLKLIGK
ncbi:MAG TPA: hypothetical protein VGK58_02685 [Lacipirellulaceae bacterium]